MFMNAINFLFCPKILPSAAEFIDNGLLKDQDVIFLSGPGGISKHVYKKERDEKALAILTDCGQIRAVWSPGLYERGIRIFIDAVERNGKTVAQD